MKMRLCGFALIYHIRRGILGRWKWYMTAVIIFALQWLLARQGARLLAASGISEAEASYMDYVLFSFRGLAPRMNMAFDAHFDLPMPWICAFAGGLVSSLGYSGMDADGHAVQLAVRAGSRRLWWASMCLWCGVSAGAYLLLAYFTLFVLSLAAGVPLSLTMTNEFAALFLGAQYYTAGTVGIFAGLELGVIMPFLFLLFLNMLQLVLNLFCGRAGAFIACVAVLILSAYYSSGLAVGNYAIVMRSAYMIEDGFAAREGQAVYLMLIMLLCIVGLVRISRLDLLPRGRERG